MLNTHWCFRIFALCVTFFAASASGAMWTVTYPRPLDDADKRSEYPIALLQLALEKTGVNYELKASDRILLSGKAIRQLRENREVNVVWSMTDAQRERDLIPIRIPIAKGLIGLRLLVINKEQEAEFANVTSRQRLMTMSPLQGNEWPDTKILQANGFNVLTVPDFREGYTVLERESKAFFPRSVIEVVPELAEGRRNNKFTIAPNIALYYPTAMYYFVSKSNPTLARLIETGLQRALDDGSFDALFNKSYDSIIEDLDVERRQIFRLENPLLPELTPVSNTELWYLSESQ